jgi:tRNA modification GTPase
MDTIFAPITGNIGGAISIVRISGQDALAALRLLGVEKAPEPRYAELCALRHEGDLVDQALVTYFKAPNSFTGEDVIEIALHNSRAVLSKMLNILGKIPNYRMAENGEFSKRAFLNDKMDLTQAEAIADLIESETEAQAKQALRQMSGSVGKIYDNWREQIINILANLEAYIDFPDEDLPQDLCDRTVAIIDSMRAEIGVYLNDNQQGERLRKGFYVTILGAPNVGKSSLMNHLAGRDVAIVSSIAGTTRDVIETHLDIKGLPVIMADTAGLRESSDAVEAEGVKRAQERGKQADLKILMFDAENIDQAHFELIDNDTIIVLNKIDKAQIDDSLKLADRQPLLISVKDNKNIDKLLAEIYERITKTVNLTSDPIITRARHREALASTYDNLAKFSLDKALELAVEDLRLAANGLGKITGRIDVEDILDRIFKSFCIGK